MGASSHHLAQVNVARMRAPLDDPAMSGFASRIDEINALAENAPGFVWRWTGADSAPFSDQRLLFNLSVWRSVEALQDYVYRTRHAGLFRERRHWFMPSAGPSLALSQIPTDHLPSPQESKERLDHLAQAGPTLFAFTFNQSFLPPEASP